MRNVFVFFLVALALIQLSGATEQDKEGDISPSEDQEMVDIQELAESGKSKGKAKRRSKDKKRRTLKKTKESKRRKGRKGRKGRKINRRNRQDKKKVRNNRKGKKSKKGENKKKRNNKDHKRKKGNSQLARQTDACETGCSDVLVAMMKAARKQNTYKKQYNRIVNGQKIAKKKGAKKGDFDSDKEDGPLNLLLAAGGGNASDLSCAGSKTNKAAMNMKNLTDKLIACKDDIEAMCNVTKKMVAIKAEWTACDASMTAFKVASDNCLKLGGVAACNCFKNASVVELKDAITACDSAEMKTASDSDLKAKRACSSKYGECRGKGEEIRPVLAACQAGGPSVADIKETVGTVLKNAATNTALKEKVTKVIKAAVREARKLSKRAKVSVEGTEFDISTCSGWTDASLAWLTALESDLETDISAIGNTIVATPVVCSAADVSKLKKVEAKAAIVKKKSDKKIEILQKKLQTISGSTVSPAEAISVADAVTTGAGDATGAGGSTGAGGASGAAGSTGAGGATGAGGSTGAGGASGAAGTTAAAGASGATGGSSGAAGSTGGASTNGMRFRHKAHKVMAVLRDLKQA